MKKEEVIARVKKINHIRDDDEAAHSMEDKLFHDFVEAISNGAYKTRKEIIDVALEVIKVRNIDFARWCA